MRSGAKNIRRSGINENCGNDGVSKWRKCYGVIKPAAWLIMACEAVSVILSDVGEKRHGGVSGVSAHNGGKMSINKSGAGSETIEVVNYGAS